LLAHRGIFGAENVFHPGSGGDSDYRHSSGCIADAAISASSGCGAMTRMFSSPMGSFLNK
jgi:hypothetical protein